MAGEYDGKFDEVLKKLNEMSFAIADVHTDISAANDKLNQLKDSLAEVSTQIDTRLDRLELAIAKMEVKTKLEFKKVMKEAMAEIIDLKRIVSNHPEILGNIDAILEQ